MKYTFYIMLALLISCDFPESFSDNDDPRWSKQVIDAEGDVGYFSSIAPSNSALPAIAYYDDESAALKFFDGTSSRFITGANGSAANADDYLAAGFWPSIDVTASGDTWISFHDFDFTYQADIQNLIGIEDEAELEQQVIEIFTVFSVGNNLSLYSTELNQILYLDWLGGQYTSLRIGPDNIARLGYCTYLPPDCRTQQDIQNGCFDDLSTEEGQAQLLTPKCNPLVMRINTNTFTTVGDSAYLLAGEDLDAGVSLDIDYIDASVWVATFIDLINFHLYFSISTNGGETWTTDILSSEEERVGEFTSLAIDRNTNPPAISILYYSATERNLSMYQTLDLASTWAKSVVFDLRGEDVGQFPSPYYDADGHLHIAHYFGSRPRSLRYTLWQDGSATIQSQIDGTTSGSVGRYPSLMQQGGSLFVSYYDRINNQLMLASSPIIDLVSSSP